MPPGVWATEREPRRGLSARSAASPRPGEPGSPRPATPPPCRGGAGGTATSLEGTVRPSLPLGRRSAEQSFLPPDVPPDVSERPTEALRALGITLPPPPKPAGTYVPVVVWERFAWVSGQVVVEAGAAVHPGAVDRDVPPEVARDLARRAALQGLSALEQALGSLDRVRRVLRVAVYVASSPGFARQHEVANGATELLVQVFGENGRPARVAMGVVALPLNAPVEVELLVATE